MHGIVGIDAAELRHLGGDVFEKIAVWLRARRRNAGSSSLSSHSMPKGRGGWWVRRAGVRREPGQGLYDREPACAASGEGAGFGLEIFEPGPAERFGQKIPRSVRDRRSDPWVFGHLGTVRPGGTAILALRD